MAGGILFSAAALCLWKSLNGGTVPPFSTHLGGTVPLISMHLGGNFVYSELPLFQMSVDAGWPYV